MTLGEEQNTPCQLLVIEIPLNASPAFKAVLNSVDPLNSYSLREICVFVHL